jgi:hypothetical protein
MFRKENHVQDNVNHPKHYTNSEASCSKCGNQVECIDITRHMNFNLGNVVKYIWRYKEKDGLEALKKAEWYLQDFIKKEENKDESK